MTTTLIKNGRVFDGTQAPSRIANILIQDGRIAQISEGPIEVTTDKVIDAEGKWVLPGFIDNHTHYDVEVLVAPGLSESVRHGVTTVMLGGCSLSFIYAVTCLPGWKLFHEKSSTLSLKKKKSGPPLLSGLSI